MTDQPDILAAFRALRERLAQDRDRAVERAPQCTMPEARQANEGIAAGLDTALFHLDGEIRQHGTAHPGDRAVHIGGNADDCPGCIANGVEKLGYPWECPGPEQAAATVNNPVASRDAADCSGGGIEPVAANTACEHHYESRILGGHPLTVRACVFCHTPDWADLTKQAAGLYRWGWQEGHAGNPARERLSCYDMPRQPDSDLTEADLDPAMATGEPARIIAAPPGVAQRCACGQAETVATIQAADGHVHVGPPLAPSLIQVDEPDEEPAAIQAAFDAGEKGVTTPSGLGQRIAAALREHGMVHLGNQVPADEYDCCADAVLTAIRPELTTLAEYESAINWATTCVSCARMLDASIRDHERAGTARAEVTRLRAGEEPVVDEHLALTPGQWIWKWNQASAEERLAKAQGVLEAWREVERFRLSDFATAAWVNAFDRANKAEAALTSVREIANELITGGAYSDGNEPGAGRRILAAIDGTEATS
ncbi:hypothetical protein [Streptomyces sp. CBMA152]|uniref:hypothetical protein n=1 Tax=Streptomyces sp. CBMA152 TaxID=1896312 RepID=UPI001660F870|nr:hypothetical protein [Streptomyces sp. CBMA152]MBD0743535.1 hypothetical protein [Streptomyces sp. CBMA152]